MFAGAASRALSAKWLTPTLRVPGRALAGRVRRDGTVPIDGADDRGTGRHAADRVTSPQAQTYGVGLWRLLQHAPAAIPARPEGGPVPDQLVDGDPGSGVVWDQRVQAQAQNRRAETGRAIAAHIGLVPAEADAPTRVVEFLNRRAGRIPAAPVAAGGLVEV